MKLTVLGCWAPYPASNQACSGYLFQCGGRNLLIDMGHGSFSKLQQVFDFSRLDGVFISHLHPDHCGDLSCLRHAVIGQIRQGKEQKRLPVYVPDEPAVNFEVLADFKDAFDIHIISSQSEDLLEIGGIECSIFKTIHPIPTYGLAAVCEGKKFIYTSDTAWDEKLVDICRDADILLCEASLLESDHHLVEKGHLTSSQAGLLADKAGAGRLVVTHLWPGYDLAELRREVSATFKNDLDLAGEFKEYTC